MNVKAKKIRHNTSDQNMTSMGADINDGMASPYFTSLTTEKAAFLAKSEAFAVALAAAHAGGREAKAAKRQAKFEMVVAGNVLCDAVNRLAKGDIVIVLASRFKPSRENITPVVMEGFKKFVVANTQTLGEVIFTAVKGRGALSVLIYWGVGDTLAEVTEWHICSQSVNQCVISGLQSGKRVWGRALATGRSGQVLWAQPISTIVL